MLLIPACEPDNNGKIMPLLSVKNLSTVFHTAGGVAKAVDGISFQIPKEKILAIVGESGCGKSVTALSLMRLVGKPSGEITGGNVFFQGKDILNIPEKEMRSIRGDRISMIFQEPMTSLNPVLTIGEQIMEVTRLHKGFSKKESLDAAIEMLKLVKIADPEKRIREYPHQLSGGMKQRVMIAIALSCEPDLLIADEPTTALDVTVQAEILTLMKELQQKKGTSIILITHDMGVVYRMADFIAVMYAGKIVESAGREEFFASACHPYTVKLFESLPSREKRSGVLSTIPGRVPPATAYPEGMCRFHDRCHHSFDTCITKEPALHNVSNAHLVACHLEDAPEIVLDTSPQSTPADVIDDRNNNDSKDLLQVDNIKVYYPIHKGIFQRVVGHVKAVDGLSISIAGGETLALVGESGCGKTTAGKGIVRLEPLSSGKVLFDGNDIHTLPQNRLRRMRKDFQIMFQDPYSSLNPRMMAGRIIAEGLVAQKIGKSSADREKIVKNVMEKVGLDPSMANRYPHEFSGGQRQRIGIARFLVLNPLFVVCDEVTSALDVSVQAQILNLLKELQQKQNLSYLFITHNLSVVAYMAHRVAVMYLGRIVEEGSIHEILDSPKHPYTEALLAASPVPGRAGKERIILEGDVPSPANPPGGCHFNPRCSYVMDNCRKHYPEKTAFSKTHTVKCWKYSSGHL